MFTLTSNGRVPEYPKIETLYDRDPANMKHVIVGAIRKPEFAAASRWNVAEKIDGTNVRVAILPDGTVFYGGRTDDAQMPPFLLQHLQETLPLEVLRRGIQESGEVVTIYGEGYGARIQKGGGNYRTKGVSFRAFDIRIGDVWLAQEKVGEIAETIGVPIAPLLARDASLDDALLMVRLASNTAKYDGGNVDHQQEGIIARSEPLMLDRLGHRVMWKLKARDLP